MLQEKKTDSRVSKYGRKKAEGRQMYGPNCCAHRITDEQMRRAHERAVERGHFARKGKPQAEEAE